MMKIKKITVEFDNGTIIDFNEQEIEALQHVRSILDFLDTGANLTNLMLNITNRKQEHPTKDPFIFPMSMGSYGPGCVENIDWKKAWKEAKEKQDKEASQ